MAVRLMIEYGTQIEAVIHAWNRPSGSGAINLS
jgi:hypothetical protein